MTRLPTKIIEWIVCSLVMQRCSDWFHSESLCTIVKALLVTIIHLTDMYSKTDVRCFVIEYKVNFFTPKFQI